MLRIFTSVKLRVTTPHESLWPNLQPDSNDNNNIIYFKLKSVALRQHRPTNIFRSAC